MFRFAAKDLVDGAGDFVVAERGDHPLDLPPVTEARNIAVVAATLGAHRRLEAGIVAITLDEVGGVGQRDASMDERAIHAANP